MIEESKIVDHNLIKQLSREEMEELVPSWFKFKTQPWKQQLACFIVSIAYNGFLNCLDLGTGKTKVAIDMCRYLTYKHKKIKVLVICLNNAVEKWADEVNLHSDIPATCLRGSSKQKWAKLRGYGFYIINFEGLRFWLCEKREVGDWKSDVRRNKLFADDKAIGKLLKFGFNVLVIDESHKVKSNQSLIFKILAKINKHVEYRTLLTGTPFGNTLLDIWSQYHIVDFGQTYGANFVRFRDANFKDKGWFGPDYKVTKIGKERITKRLFNRAMRYNEEEVDDLPEKVYRVVDYRLSTAQDKEYVALAKDESISLSNIKNKVMVYRQICSGFIKSTSVEFKHNPKLDAIKEKIEEVVDRSKIVIFHEFIIEGLFVEKILKKLKIEYATLNGSTKNKDKEIKRFANDGKCRVMVAHPLSGGSSIDLVSAKYCFFLSNGYSAIERRQCEKRIHRGGQASSRVFYYDFVCKQSIELKIFNDLMAGVDAFSQIVDGTLFKQMVLGER
jgi:SNF2 family DNA or RNA helicase